MARAFSQVAPRGDVSPLPPMPAQSKTSCRPLHRLCADFVIVAETFSLAKPKPQLRSWGLGFARNSAFTSSPANSAWEDVVFVSRQGAKLAKEIQRRNTADPEALRTARGLPNRSFRRARKVADNGSHWRCDSLASTWTGGRVKFPSIIQHGYRGWAWRGKGPHIFPGRLRGTLIREGLNASVAGASPRLAPRRCSLR
jgi:hypothetical protein